MAAATLKQRTSRAFGYLWDQRAATAEKGRSHYASVEPFLPPGHLRGRVLDAGCGVGQDSWEMASRDGAQVWSIDLTWAGVRKTQEQVRGLAAGVIQGDLENLPFSEGVFDFVYSYGVVHHLPNPFQGFKELVRVLKPQGVLAIYVYEDFKTRTAFERWLLGAVGILRLATTRMPSRFLYGLCWLLSPVVFLSMTLPHQVLVRWRTTRGFAYRIPFRHGRTWFGLAPDLYDRFAAPIERRYDKDLLMRWLQGAGLSKVQVVPHRGWVASGVKS